MSRGIYMDPYRDWRPLTDEEASDPVTHDMIALARRRVADLPSAGAIHFRADGTYDLVALLASAYVQGVYDTTRIAAERAAREGGKP